MIIVNIITVSVKGVNPVNPANVIGTSQEKA